MGPLPGRSPLRAPALRLGAFGLWLALAVLFTGCRRERYPLQEISVAGATVADNAVLGLSPSEIREVFTAALGAHGGYLLPAQDRPEKPPRSSRAVLELGFTRFVQRDESARTAAEVGARLLLWRDGPDGEREYEVSGAAEVGISAEGAEARASALRQALREAVSAAVAAMHLQLVATDQRDGRLVADLASGDGRVRDAAIRVLADRRNPAVTPSLVSRLGSDDPAQLRRTIGQLVELGDPRAVAPLIELTRGRDPGFLREVLYALGELGGAEAEAYLYTVAQGHDQSAVRAAAAEALEELQARAKRHPPAAPDASAHNGEGRR